ncbi:hypothetical protein [Thiocystis violacea]|uniref:hypothetical protein n=1 Tax=Thiocystis violacea TaxID=13725 RepID=UPI00190800A7|nr:hypothetical protein [Thiocystis violacea]MBK1724459.1 hypothetical protein [Thiocystis violacea]
MRRLAYRNASLPWSGRPGSGDGGYGSGRTSGAGNAVATRRDDDLWGLGLDLSFAWSADLSTLVTLSGARCESPVPADAYWRGGTALLVRWVPEPNWRLELGLGWARTQFDRAPRRIQRRDDQLNAGLAVRRAVGQGEWFCSLDWLGSDSTFEPAAFQQQVTTCGFAWSY